MPSESSRPINGSTRLARYAVGEIGMADIWEVVRRQRVIVIGMLLAGWALAIFYFVVAPRKYESTAQVLVMRKDPKLATTGVQAAREDESKISEDLLATHMQIVQSKRIVAQSLQQDGLEKLPSIISQLADDETPADYVIDNLYVSRGGTGQAKTAHVLNIAFRHSSDEDCRRVVNSIVQTYQHFLAEKFQDVNKEAAELIVKAQTDLGQDLEKAEVGYQEFREKLPLLFNGDQVTNIHRARYDQIQQELSTLEIQCTEARARLEIVDSATREMDERGASDLERLALIDERNVERLGVLVTVDRGQAETAEFQALQPERMASATAEYSALLTLMAKEKTLLSDYGPAHPEVKGTREQIALMRDFLTKRSSVLGTTNGGGTLLTPRELMQTYVQLLKNDVASQERRKSELVTLASNEEAAAKLLVSYELDGEAMRRDVARKQELYDAVVDRLRDINMAKDYGGYINETIAPPEVGEVVSPNLLICLVLGTIVGLIGAGGGVVIGEYRDASFHSPEEISETLELPLLSHLPDLEPLRDLQLAASISDGGSQMESSLLSFHRPKSREAEVFRGLRTSLFYSARSQEFKVIQCTSPNQGDGKSTMIANLAASIAQAGKRVLLIDCDLRRPRVHTMFGIDNRVGLSNVIGGDVAAWDAVQPTEAENLFVLPCGEIPENPAELLTSPKFDELLALARERYDYVLLDTPPVLAVADPCIVAPRVDAVVLLVRVSKDRRPQVVRAKEMLTSVAAKLVGVIVNASEAGKEFGSKQYGYGNQYGYGYGYGNGTSGDYYSSESKNGTPRDSRRHVSAQN